MGSLFPTSPQYCSRCISCYARILVGSGRHSVKSFQTAKAKLISSSVLAHQDCSLPLRLAGDASAYGVGSVIWHLMIDESEWPIAFASRILSSAEKDYAQVEKEALSLVFGIKRFHTYLYSQLFTIITDHKPLTGILGQKRVCLPWQLPDCSVGHLVDCIPVHN